MKVSHVDHDYLELYKDPLEKYFFPVQMLHLMLPFYVYHEIYFYFSYILREKKTSKLGIYEILP